MRCKASSTRKLKNWSPWSNSLRSKSWSSATCSTKWASLSAKKTTTRGLYLRVSKKLRHYVMSASLSESRSTNRRRSLSWRHKKLLSWLRTYRPSQERTASSTRSLARAHMLTNYLRLRLPRSSIRRGGPSRQSALLKSRKKTSWQTIATHAYKSSD